ncbi:tryptophan-rich sensory protein [Patescibacteria group bacterium]|nr:tryptophan-rich sensory protein [Patescibacteria group bacterium]MBU4367827.1 tryptophan-rich sensory protein [Patescibacteria group bacterium]MBU4461960.1 tryptophan-rich sensory protein [Patescibacteria group bacterium]MCG2700379.1 tryptophan-rich sensory protein [Candidatus Parcubacteria bacterium]
MQNNILNNNTKNKNGSAITITKLMISIVVCQLAGLVGAVFMIPAMEGWYKNLRKPFFAPPDWIFSPVWIILFMLMGVSLFLVWKKRADGEARVVFFTQLILNILWSAFFFGLKSPGLAFIELVFLWFAILCTIIIFYKIYKLAGLLLLPYILWVTFAGVLNFSIWIINWF